MAKTGTTTRAENQLSNGSSELIETGIPYICRVTIRGTCDLLLNRFNTEEYGDKAAAGKGSAIKKQSIPENRVYRNKSKQVCLPGIYLCNAIAQAAKFFQDPRSPRKSAHDLYKASVIPNSTLAPLTSVTGKKPKDGWDYLDKQGANVNRSRIVRERPAFLEGWECTFDLLVQTPELISSKQLHSVIEYAGKLIGVGDYRPTYGRFQTVQFEVLDL